jgi:hypothetical protein
MSDVKYKIEWLEELLKRFWQVKMQQVLNTWIKKSIIYVEWEAKKETPVDKWQLRNSYQTQFGNLTWKLYTTVKYAPFVHEWTASYTIVPVRKKWLASKSQFYWKKVNHPWIKSNPWLTRTKEKTEQPIIMIFNKEISKALQNN